MAQQEKTSYARDEMETPCLSLDELLGYAAHKLTEGEHRKVEAHLKQCEFCRKALSGFSAYPDQEEIRAAFRSIDDKIRLQSFFYRIKQHNRLVRYAIAAALLIGLASLIYRTINVTAQGPFIAGMWDEQTPYAYEPSTYEGGILRSQEGANDAFMKKMNLGLSEYASHRYIDAIQIFESLEFDVREFKSSDSLQAVARDFYFYLAASHLALSKSEKFNLNKKVKSKHAVMAIHYFSLADSLARAQKIESDNRETYFLGVAYACANQFDLATITLRRIMPNSKFYQQSTELIRRISQK